MLCYKYLLSFILFLSRSFSSGEINFSDNQNYGKINFTTLFYHFVNTTNNSPKNVSSDCWQHLKNVISDEKILSHLISISGNFPPDYENLMYSDFGDYDQCLSGNETSFTRFFTPKYCLSFLMPNWDYIGKKITSKEKIAQMFPHYFNDKNYGHALMIGICLPANCKDTDLETIIGESINNTYWSMSRKSKCTTSNISIIGPIKGSNTSVLISFIAFLLATFLVLIAAFNDLLGCKLKSRIILLFSPKTNFKNLLERTTTSKFEAFNNLRIYANLLVIIVHLAIPIPFYLSLTDMNLSKIDLLSNFWLQPYANFHFSKVIFYLSGCFAAISLRNEKKLTIKQVVTLIFWRFIKMQPFILACVCFELNIPLIGGSGPVYDTVIDTKIDSIVEHLPYLVLHILDYKYMKYSLSEMKLFAPIQLWTISVEFQMYITTILILYLVQKTKLSCLFPVSIVITFLSAIAWIIMMNIDPIPFTNSIITNKNLPMYFLRYNFTPIANLWNFILAFYVVSLIIEGKLDNINQINKRKLLTIASIICLIASFLSSYFATFKHQFTPLSKCVYMLIVEPIYALHCCSILIFCGQSASKYVSRSENNDINHKNQASTTFTVKRRKSPFSFVQLIDNLLKSAFYTHYAVITWIFASTRKSIYLISVHNMTLLGQSILAIILSSVIFHFVFLSPINRLFLLFRKKVKPKSVLDYQPNGFLNKAMSSLNGANVEMLPSEISIKSHFVD